MDFFITPFTSNEFMLRALAAGTLVSVACAMVGTFVVLRGLSFIGDALAHGVLPGIAIAILLGAPGWIGAAVGSLVMIGGISLITNRSRLSSDAAIGLLFVGMLALGVVIVSRSDAFMGDLMRVLFGEMLGLGGVFLWSANLTQPGKAQQPTCNEMAFAPNYKLVILAYPFAFSYSEAILVPTNGLSLITPNMDSLAHVGEYVLGHSTESSPRYFWFNLWTRTIKRYSDEQSARSAEVVQKLGLTGVPELKDADIICSEARCRPCSSEVNVDDLSAK